MNNFKCTIASAVATSTSIAATMNGDDIIAWIGFIANVLIMIVNVGSEIVKKYKEFKNKDGDK